MQSNDGATGIHAHMCEPRYFYFIHSFVTWSFLLILFEIEKARKDIHEDKLAWKYLKTIQTI